MEMLDGTEVVRALGTRGAVPKVGGVVGAWAYAESRPSCVGGGLVVGAAGGPQVRGVGDGEG